MISGFGSGGGSAGSGRGPVDMVCVATDWDAGRVGRVKVSPFSPLSWLALRTEFGLLPLREEKSPLSLKDADEGRSTSREIRLSSSSLLVE